MSTPIMYPLSAVFKPQMTNYADVWRNAEMTTGPYKPRHVLPIPVGVSMIQIDYRMKGGSWKTVVTINGEERQLGKEEYGTDDLKPRFFRVVNDDPGALLTVQCKLQSTVAINTARVGVTIIPLDVQTFEITI